MPAKIPKRLVRAEGVMANRRSRFTIVLEDVHDKHNVSAVLRTCEAFGVQSVHIVNELQEMTPLNKGVTKGAHRWLTVHQHQGTAKAIRHLRENDFKIYVGVLTPDAVPLPDIKHDSRAAYVFGNERSGLTQTWLNAADSKFIIPTCGFSGSLNLSVAAGLTIYDRLLGQPGGRLPPGDLTESEKTTLRQEWYRTLAHGSKAVHRQYEPYLDNTPTPENIPATNEHGEPRTR